MLLTDELTDKENQVLRMLGKGKDSREIAITYGVTTDTVYNWMQKIRNKLGAETDTQAVVMALVAGIIQ